jgi:TM2 domain-containing membrane protein YozV
MDETRATETEEFQCSMQGFILVLLKALGVFIWLGFITLGKWSKGQEK